MSTHPGPAETTAGKAMAETDPRLALFVAAGLNKKTAKQILKKKKIAAALCEVLAEVGCTVETPCNRTVANLLYDVCTTLEEGMAQHRSLLVAYIECGKLATGRQLEHAIAHLKALASDAAVDVPALEAASGIGVVVSADEVKAAVTAAIGPFEEEIRAERYGFPQGKVMSSKLLKQGRMLWSNGKVVKDELAAQVLAILGPKTAEDDAKAEARKKGGKKKKKKAKEPKAAAAVAAGSPPAAPAASAEEAAAAAAAAAAYEGQSLFALAADAGMVGRLLESMQNSEAAYEEHRRVTGGVIRTRFPPEPNGYLHIGHAKSMHLNFHGAFEKLKMKGETIFRYDDTNPAAESTEFIDSIRESVHWLGWTPCRTTYSSEYFDKLYELAVDLIRRGYAFVCHETKVDMAAAREIAKKLHEKAQLANEARLAKPGGAKQRASQALDFVAEHGDPRSPTRDRSVEENVRLFEAMRNGAYPTGGATLRMKMDWNNPNPNFWDPVAYRIKYVTHPHVGDKWCIYPSYDYTHCIVDSLEHIDYSLCTLEFEARRDSCVASPPFVPPQ
jgi:glutaminyl-tRNA synthetase